MLRTLLIGVATAGLVGVTSASANQQTSTTSGTATSSPTAQPQTPANDTTSTTQKSATTGSSTTAGTELSGVVKKVDKDNHALKISSNTGSEQELKVPSSATITRDGSQASLDQIKEGDQVRASLNPSGTQATTISVTSKAKSDSSSKSDTSSKSK